MLITCGRRLRLVRSEYTPVTAGIQEVWSECLMR
jgi:hypothetical protein